MTSFDRSRAFPALLVLLAAVGVVRPTAAQEAGGRAEQAAVTEQAAVERPNVLVLFTDDQRADAWGAAGNPYVSTPAMDSLAQAGFRFRNAYVMGAHHGAVCAPSRAMLMTGRSLFHVYDNLDTLRTFPQQLADVGYRTFGTGKWHNGMGAFARSFQEGRRVMFGGMSDHHAVYARDMRADGTFTEVDSVGFSSTVFADAAIDFVDAHAASGVEAPFLAYVAFTAPHDPRTPPEPYRSAYAECSFPLPPNFMPLHPFNLGPGSMAVRDEHLAPWPRPVDVVRDQVGEYYGLIAHMDVQIGRILGALRRHGLAENTLVVLAGDNGLALGSHGLMGKQSLYEHSTRVPLVVAGPGVRPGTSDALVYLYDITPTLLEAAGATALPRMDGRSLVPVWTGEREALRPTLFTAYEDAIRAVRDDRWKLIRYPRLDRTQLFDLGRDPYELDDRSGDPDQAGRVARMEGLLRDWQVRTDDPHPFTSDDPIPEAFNYTQIERRVDRWQPGWVVEKYFGERTDEEASQ